MQLEISSQEHELLVEVLESWRTDARAEVHRTLDTRFKSQLKAKLSLAEGLIAKLHGTEAMSASA